ncbi:MAG TPA: hypothetical protein VLX44_14910 [Xanthobacteraceae bacterium]|nr:hypothetical protein [Xanthobacteraceae bacterium]
MTTTSKLALVATLATLIAAPAFAAEQGSNEAAGYALSLQAARSFGGAYASARGVQPTQVWHSDNAAQDFQLQGR